MKSWLRKKAEDAASRLPALMIRAERAAGNILHGEHAQKKAGSGEKFWQFRDYTSADRPQDIDWRQSGKTDRVFIRQKERQNPQTALLWCSSYPGMDFSSAATHPSKAEQAKILTLALSILFTHAGERVGLLGEAQTGRSEATLEFIGNMLLGKNSHALPEAALTRGQKNASVVLLGDFLDEPEKIEATFKMIAAQTGGGIVVQVLDPAEIDLPYEGRAIFETADAAYHENVENVVSIRAAYNSKIQDHLGKIDKICRSCGWHYFLHRTDEPPEKVLRSIFDLFTALQMRRF